MGYGDRGEKLHGLLLNQKRLIALEPQGVEIKREERLWRISELGIPGELVIPIRLHSYNFDSIAIKVGW